MKFLKTLGGAIVEASVQTAAGCFVAFCGLMALDYYTKLTEEHNRKVWEKQAEEAAKTE